MKKTITLFAFGLVLAVAACKKEPNFKEVYYSPEQYNAIAQYLDLPDGLLRYDDINFPASLRREGLAPRPIENAKATLGRVLFYDKHLSKDGTISCASCHRQSVAFSDNAAFSRGVLDRQTTRNSFPLGSVTNFSAYYGTDINGPLAVRFFWDNRAGTVADQCRGSLTNPNEMDMRMEDVVAAVQAQPYYRPLFDKAFSGGVINEDNILQALTHFVNAIGSYNTRFDQEASAAVTQYKSVSDDNFPGFTVQENTGKALYMNNCSSCHGVSIGRAPVAESSNGLDLDPTDKGIGEISNRQEDMGIFKVPTLRNIALTGPYMHDGRFNTLEEVIEHYSTGIKAHPNLGHQLRQPNGQPARLNFTADEKAALLAFLNTLTDDKQREDARFADPFK